MTCISLSQDMSTNKVTLLTFDSNVSINVLQISQNLLNFRGLLCAVQCHSVPKHYQIRGLLLDVV